MRILIFALLSVVLLGGCESERDTDSHVVVTSKGLDMSDEVISKRWFESNFINSYLSLATLEGRCLTWGPSGTCSYKIVFSSKQDIEPSKAVLPVDCSEIYDGFARFFEKESQGYEKDEIICFWRQENDDIQYIVHPQTTTIYFVWDIFEI